MNAPLGSVMSAEMFEQPQVLARLSSVCPDISSRIRELCGSIQGVAFLARGSSDNAALLGRYAVEVETGLPTCLLAPSVITAYGRPPEGFRGWLVVALSQSGRTPEIVDVSTRFSEAGAYVVAITNDGRSELAQVSHVSVDVAAGPERAVPATKTVTAQMLSVVAVVEGLRTGRSHRDHSQAADIAREVLNDDAGVVAAASVLAQHDRVAVVARGLCYPAAREMALKLQETTGAMAHAFSTADFRHGPIAVCGPDAPAVLIAGSGIVDQDTTRVRENLAARGARTILVAADSNADIGFPRAAGALECIAATIRGQQLALATCRALGVDPDAPAGLNKVTQTY